VTDSAQLDRDALIAELARTAAESRLRAEQGGVPAEARDRDQATEIVAALERLGLYPPRPRPSRFAFFRHPLVVGAGVAAASAVFASLLIPSITRVSADRPKELELKRGIVSDIATSSAQALTRGLALARKDYALASGGSSGKRLTAYRKVTGDWLESSGALDAELITYFPKSHAEQWERFANAVGWYLSLAGIADHDVRVPASRNLRDYLKPLAAERRYRKVPWMRLETDVDPHWIPTIMNLLLAQRNVVVADVVHGEANGFKHSVWSLGYPYSGSSLRLRFACGWAWK